MHDTKGFRSLGLNDARCQPCFRVSQFLGVDRCGGRGGVHYWLRKRKYMLSTFCVDNSVDELFLTAPSRLFT